MLEFKNEGKTYRIPDDVLAPFEVKKGRFKPELWEEFWYVNSYGETSRALWSNSTGNIYLFTTNNCFKTEEEAEYKIQHDLLWGDIGLWADKHNDEIDWKDIKTRKYYLPYVHSDKQWKVNTCFYFENSNTVYFSSSEIAIECIKLFKERLKKYGL